MTERAIDVHIHLYPEAAMADPAGWASARGERHWLDLVAPAGRPSLQGWRTVEQCLADMDAGGVERAVLLGWYWENAATCREQNDFYAAILKQYPERFSAFCALHFAEPDAAVKELRRCIDLGFIGIGEALPAIQNCAMDSPGFLKVLAVAEQEGLALNLHVTEPVGHDYPGRIPTPLDGFLRLAGRFPNLPIILAHWGGLLPFFALNPRVRPLLKHVFFDTAASPLLYDKAIWELAVKAVGAEKILFGSDYPLRVRPRTEREPSFAPILGELAAAGLSDAEQAAIRRNNAASLLFPNQR